LTILAPPITIIQMINIGPCLESNSWLSLLSVLPLLCRSHHPTKSTKKIKHFQLINSVNQNNFLIIFFLFLFLLSN
jgi:hypothetical protein